MDIWGPWKKIITTRPIYFFFKDPHIFPYDPSKCLHNEFVLPMIWPKTQRICDVVYDIVYIRCTAFGKISWNCASVSGKKFNQRERHGVHVEFAYRGGDSRLRWWVRAQTQWCQFQGRNQFQWKISSRPWHKFLFWRWRTEFLVRLLALFSIRRFFFEVPQVLWWNVEFSNDHRDIGILQSHMRDSVYLLLLNITGGGH